VIVLDLLLLAAGYGVLVACGLVRRLGDGLRLAGLAFVLGVASMGVLLSLALVLGASESAWLVVALALLLAAAGVVGARLVPAAARGAVRPGRRSWIAVAAAAAGVVYLGWILRTVHAAGTSTVWDAWAFWLPKARTIYWFGGLDSGVGGFTSFANPDYPPLVPAFDAAVFRFAGRPDGALIPVQEWLLLVAFLAGAAGLLLRRLPAAPVALSLLLLLLAPDVGASVGASLGDLPLALLLATAAVCLALWLVEKEPRLLVPAAVALAAAALTKKEGTALAVLLLVVTAVAGHSRRRLLPLLAVAGAPLAARVAWAIWIRVEHVPAVGDYRLGDLADPGYLFARWGRLGASAHRVPGYLFDVGRWGIALPLALLLALLVRRRVGALLLAWVALGLVGLTALYWISFLPLSFHLESSAPRTVLPIVVVGVALLPLLLAEALSAEQRVGGAPEAVLEVDRRLEAEHLARG
jgi:hypothetical protein